MNERLYRSRDERMIAGVAGGVAERFDVDPSLVRVLWVVLVFLSGGIFLLLYIAMAVLVPEAPVGTDRWPTWGTDTGPRAGAVPGWGAPASGTQAFAASPPPGSGPAGTDAPRARPPRRRPPRRRRRGRTRPPDRTPPPGPTSRRSRRHRRRGAGLPDRATGDITAAGVVVAGSSPASSWSSSAAISCCAPSSPRST